MPLSVPTTDEFLAEARRETFDDVAEEEFAALSLRRATDLMELALGISEDPDDLILKRVMDFGILSMALKLHIEAADSDAIHSRFSGERLGSYSYQKAAEVRDGVPTGVEAFDRAVTLIRYRLGEHYWGTTEHVFEQPFKKEEDDWRVRDKGLQDKAGR